MTKKPMTTAEIAAFVDLELRCIGLKARDPRAYRTRVPMYVANRALLAAMNALDARAEVARRTQRLLLGLRKQI